MVIKFEIQVDGSSGAASSRPKRKQIQICPLRRSYRRPSRRDQAVISP